MYFYKEDIIVQVLTIGIIVAGIILMIMLFLYIKENNKNKKL